MKHSTIRPKDAATLALLRRSGTSVTVLMGQRGKEQVFMPERYVFPGGGVEVCDRYVRPAAELSKNVAERLARSCSLARARSLACLLYTSPSPRDGLLSRMPSYA